VPAEDMIGERDGLAAVAANAQICFAPRLGADACGLARRALDESILHAKRASIWPARFGPSVDPGEAGRLQPNWTPLGCGL